MLTVLTVQQSATAYWGAGATVAYAYPDDQDLVKQAHTMAQEETDSTQVTHHARCPVVVIPADNI